MDPIPDLFEEISGWGQMESLIHFNINSNSLFKIPHSFFFSSLKGLIDHDPLLKLISDYLSIPILDNAGVDHRPEIGVPPSSPLTPVLINKILTDVDLFLKIVPPAITTIFSRPKNPISAEDFVLALEGAGLGNVGLQHYIVILRWGVPLRIKKTNRI